MEKLKQFDGLITLSRCNSKSDTISDPIPSDVLMDIVSRLPAKSVGKCRCVSKLWALILGRPEFEELFLTKSMSRPQFLFSFVGGSEFPFFTSPQIQNPNHDNSSSLVVTPHHTYLPADGLAQVCRPVRGWVCIKDQRGMFVVCNPITGRSFVLPKLKNKMIWVKTVLGYDPIDKQFKVLCSTWSPFDSLDIPAEHYVLTFGSEQLVWRTIECCKPIRHLATCGDGICINGFLYYISEFNNYKDIFIVCFDIRFEKLTFISKPKDMWSIGDRTRLINHKGQLGIMQSPDCWKINGYITRYRETRMGQAYLRITSLVAGHSWTDRVVHRWNDRYM